MKRGRAQKKQPFSIESVLILPLYTNAIVKFYGQHVIGSL